MSEEQTFRSEANGSLPLSGRRSSVVQEEIQAQMVKREVAKRTVKLYSWVSSLLQVRPSLTKSSFRSKSSSRSNRSTRIPQCNWRGTQSRNQKNRNISRKGEKRQKSARYPLLCHAERSEASALRSSQFFRPGNEMQKQILRRYAPQNDILLSDKRYGRELTPENLCGLRNPWII